MKFTIITASYNYADYIKETIESVLSQTFPNWEMLIVDDGSSDNSIEVIKSYAKKDSRIKLLQHENACNKGLKDTILLGVSQAKNDWLVFLESDDTISSDYLECKLNIIKKNPDVKFIFNSVNLFGEETRIKNYEKYFKLSHKLLSTNTYPCRLLKYFERINIVPTFSCVAVNKELFQNLNFDSPLKPLLDYFLWLQIAQKTEMYYLDKKLTNWRMHKNSYISNPNSDYDVMIFDLMKHFFIKTEYNNLWFARKCIKVLARYVRGLVIKLHPKEKRIKIFGRWYSYAK